MLVAQPPTRGRRILRAVAFALFGLVSVGVVVARSGRQPARDIVALAQSRLGVPLETRMVPVADGVRLQVMLSGPADGPPVILLHGYPEFWWGWHEQIARLARAGFRVIAPDQRGYDGSDKPPAIDDYRVDLLVADVLALVERLGYQQVFLAGHDWGGAIAWYVTLAHPERVRRLAIFNAPHPLAFEDARQDAPEEHTINWFRTFFQLPVLPELVARAGNWGLLAGNLRDTSRPGTFSPEDLDLYRSAWDRDGAMHAMINWYRALRRHPPHVTGDGLVRVPTRLVWGVQDRFFEHRLAGLSLRHCADARLTELPEAGHWLLHEEPDATSAAMIAFFRDG